jgi:hypothetical protein
MAPTIDGAARPPCTHVPITATVACAPPSPPMQYSCSCCNASHALTIARAYARATDGGELSPACRRAQRQLACRPCDPEVGTGLKAAVCRATCDSIYAACVEVGGGCGLSLGCD